MRFCQKCGCKLNKSDDKEGVIFECTNKTCGSKYVIVHALVDIKNKQWGDEL